VLCTLDDSDEVEGVLKAAATLACAYQAQLFLVHVVSAPAGNSDIDMIPYTKELVETADVKLRELKGQLGIQAAHSVLEGEVSECVRQEAIRRKADLIVTGRGQMQSKFSRMWSQLYPIVRESPCPVLSI
jgi:nucleotide-binding universal stress UspA family protein